jgi:branched-subunit amino acid aminotransferase/4-amino-4-deoxychorismate lyase
MQTIPTGEHIRALDRQRARLERHLERCQAAAAESHSPNPPLGRELDDAWASLARVRAELASFRR